MGNYLRSFATPLEYVRDAYFFTSFILFVHKWCCRVAQKGELWNISWRDALIYTTVCRWYCASCWWERCKTYSYCWRRSWRDRNIQHFKPSLAYISSFQNHRLCSSVTMIYFNDEQTPTFFVINLECKWIYPKRNGW